MLLCAPKNPQKKRKKTPRKSIDLFILICFLLCAAAFGGFIVRGCVKGRYKTPRSIEDSGPQCSVAKQLPFRLSVSSVFVFVAALSAARCLTAARPPELLAGHLEVAFLLSCSRFLGFIVSLRMLLLYVSPKFAFSSGTFCMSTSLGEC